MEGRSCEQVAARVAVLERMAERPDWDFLASWFGSDAAARDAVQAARIELERLHDALSQEAA